MGMFDTVNVKCNICGNILEFQSKAGECALNIYDIYSVPPTIAGDLIGETQLCMKCFSTTTIDGSIKLYPRIEYE